jgi:hypothetical protein
MGFLLLLPIVNHPAIASSWEERLCVCCGGRPRRVRRQRGPHGQLPLPVPSHDGSIELLKSFVNVSPWDFQQNERITIATGSPSAAEL